MKNLKEEWECYQQCQKKLELELDQVKILSWLDSIDSTAFFRVINPITMKNMEYPRVKVSNLSPAQLELIKDSGIALHYEKKILLVDKLLFKSFVDLFGLTKATARPSFWRDLHLADMFNEYGGSVIASYGWCDNRRTIMAFHSRDLQTMGITAYSLALGVMERFGADLINCFHSKTKFQVELDLHASEEDSWKKTIIIRDDCIGRESLTVLVAYRKSDALVYLNELKKSHRSKVTVDSVLDDIQELLTECSFTVAKVTYSKVLTAVKPIIGKRRMSDFHVLISKHLQELGCCLEKKDKNEIEKRTVSPGQLLEIAASATAAQYGNQENEFRFRLGMLCKC